MKQKKMKTSNIPTLLGAMNTSKKDNIADMCSSDEKVSVRGKNILLIGPPGTEKAKCYFKSNLLHRKYGPIVVTDPKGVLYHECASELRQQGYDVNVLNLDEMWNSTCYNPFTYLRYVNEKTKEVVVNLTDEQMSSGDYNLVASDVLQMTELLMKNIDHDHNWNSQDPFWAKAEQMYLSSIIYYICYNFPKCLQNFNSVLYLIRKSKIKDGEESPLDKMFEEWRYGQIVRTPHGDVQYNYKIVKPASKSASGRYTPPMFDKTEPTWISQQPKELQPDYLVDDDGIVRRTCWINMFGMHRKAVGSDHFAIKQYLHLKSGVRTEKTMSSIILSVAARLSLMNIPEVSELLRRDDMELQRLGQKERKPTLEKLFSGGRIAWFIVTKPSDNTFNFIADLFYMQVFQMIDLAAKRNQGRCPSPVDLYMDEWAQLGEIPHFVETLAYTREMNVSITIGLQSLDQIKERYEKSWQQLIACCDSVLCTDEQYNPMNKSFLSEENAKLEAGYGNIYEQKQLNKQEYDKEIINKKQNDKALIIEDPKGLLLYKLAPTLKDQGYAIKQLNLDEMWKSNHYNPFVYLKYINTKTKEVAVNLTDEQLQSGEYKLIDEDVLQFVQSIMKSTDCENTTSSQDPFWSKAERIYLSSIIYYICYNYPKRLQNFASVLDLIHKSETPEGEKSILDKMFDEWELGKIVMNGQGEPQYNYPILQPATKNILGKYVSPVFNKDAPTWISQQPKEEQSNYVVDNDGVVRMLHWINEFGVLQETAGENNVAIKFHKYFQSGVKSEKTQATIMLLAAARLAPMNIPEVSEFLRDDDMELERLGQEEPTLALPSTQSTGGRIAWFIVTKPSDNTFNFIANLFYTQVFQMIDLVTKHNEGHCPTPITLCLKDGRKLEKASQLVETLAHSHDLHIRDAKKMQTINGLKN